MLQQPAEWQPQAALWLAMPHLPEEWGEAFEGARAEFVGLLRTLLAAPPQHAPPPLRVLVPGEAEAAWLRARLTHHAALEGTAWQALPMPFGDVWLRDTGPVFVHDAAGEVAAQCFGFDGWGGKYVMPGDAGLAARIANQAGVPARAWPLTLEGGSIEVDGEGTGMTTRDCLLRGGRRGLDGAQPADEAAWCGVLQQALGIERLLWLEGCLQNDHTDGHIDTLARFLAPGVVVCMEPASDDLNREVLHGLRQQLQDQRDAGGRRLEVLALPSPGSVLDLDGQPMPASYCNFIIANGTVVLPCYGVANDDVALAKLQAWLPQHRVVGAPARWLLHGGGAFHCMTQQQPERRARG